MWNARPYMRPWALPAELRVTAVLRIVEFGRQTIYVPTEASLPLQPEAVRLITRKVAELNSIRAFVIGLTVGGSNKRRKERWARGLDAGR